MITKDEFEDLMNEDYSQVRIGKLQYGAGTTLRAVSPTDFDVLYNEYLEFLEQSNEEE